MVDRVRETIDTHGRAPYEEPDEVMSQWYYCQPGPQLAAG